MLTLTSWQNKYSSSVVNMNGLLRYFTNNRPTNPNSSDLSVCFSVCLSVCLQGCWLYLLWDGDRSTSVSWFHSGGGASLHIQTAGWEPISQSVFNASDVFCTCLMCILCAGTPTEHSWPGITSNDEFVAYNYPQYRAERLSNHTPRYTTVPHTGTESVKNHWNKQTNKHSLICENVVGNDVTVCVCLCVCQAQQWRSGAVVKVPTGQ